MWTLTWPLQNICGVSEPFLWSFGCMTELILLLPTDSDDPPGFVDLNLRLTSWGLLLRSLLRSWCPNHRASRRRWCVSAGFCQPYLPRLISRKRHFFPDQIKVLPSSWVRQILLLPPPIYRSEWRTPATLVKSQTHLFGFHHQSSSTQSVSLRGETAQCGRFKQAYFHLFADGVYWSQGDFGWVKKNQNKQLFAIPITVDLMLKVFFAEWIWTLSIKINIRSDNKQVKFKSFPPDV